VVAVIDFETWAAEVAFAEVMVLAEVVAAVVGEVDAAVAAAR